LNIELTPIYAIEPQKAFAGDTYAVLQELLAGQIQAESSQEFVERVSIPGVLTGRTVKLFSGQVVPLLAPQNPRGMYGSKINTLVSAAIETVQTTVGDAQEDAIRRRAVSSTGFITIYGISALHLRIGRSTLARRMRSRRLPPLPKQ
jgi:hypothetical protein